LERVGSARVSAGQAHQAIVPIAEHVVFLTLVGEAVKIAADHRRETQDLVLVADRHTLLNVPDIGTLDGAVSRGVVLGGRPSGWDGPLAHVCEDGHSPLLHEKDHLFVLVSDHFSLAIIGTAGLDVGEHPSAFRGGWTLDRPYTLELIDLLDLPALAGTPINREPGSEYFGLLANTAVNLMAIHARDLEARQRDIALEKADLFSVLNILKAISAKRRAHDVLFVFVEQIARVVSSDRCSVVRVWGGGTEGQVLASHEDESVTNRTIDLTKYPEIGAALERHDKVVISDAQPPTLTREFAPDLRRAEIYTLLVIPIVLFDVQVGSLLLRAARREGSFTPREMSFFEIVAEAGSNAIERAHLFESIQQAHDRLEHLAITDGLTGLYNQRHFREQFQQEFERSRRYALPLSLVIFDVDDFKNVNDTYGHLVGDRILCEIAHRVIHSVRNIDLVARYGGEEFVVVMPMTDHEGAVAQAERIRQLVGGAAFSELPPEHRVTVSVGLAVLTGDMESGEDLLRAADRALYEAKTGGKNRVIAAPERENP